MPDNSDDPWNILKGFMGIPQPPVAPIGQGPFAPDTSPFPPNITGGRLLMVPVPSATDNTQRGASSAVMPAGVIPASASAALLGNIPAPISTPSQAANVTLPIQQNVQLPPLVPATQRPDLRPVLQNPAVAAEMQKALAQSNPGPVGSNDQHEQGGWVRQNSKGDMWIERWPQGPSGGGKIAPDSAWLRSLVGPLVDDWMGNKTIAEFHTHPAPTGSQEVDSEDKAGVDASGVPGLIVAPGATYGYGPHLPSRPPPPLLQRWFGS